MSRNTRTRRTVLATAGVLGGAALALALPSMASAHVGVSPDELAAGDYGVLTFSFSHGCDESPTTALQITMPEGLTSVAPTVDSDWNIDVERGDDGLVSAVTYTAVTPVPNGLRGAVSMSVGLDESAADSLAFPVVQECVEGATEWTQLAADGEDPHDLDSPAPVLSVGAAAADGHADHDSSDASTDSAASDDTHAAEESHEAADASDPLAVALGAGGLVAGVAALIVAVLAYRRKA